jgi:hypothetical protein
MAASRKARANLFGVAIIFVRKSVVSITPLNRTTFGAIAVEQLLIAVTAQEKVELPNQVPHILHPVFMPCPPNGL